MNTHTHTHIYIYIEAYVNAHTALARTHTHTHICRTQLLSSLHRYIWVTNEINKRQKNTPTTITTPTTAAEAAAPAAAAIHMYRRKRESENERHECGNVMRDVCIIHTVWESNLLTRARRQEYNYCLKFICNSIRFRWTRLRSRPVRMW